MSRNKKPEENWPDVQSDDEAMAETDDGYQVGYGKPPKHTQFQKGQSGNPRGRRKSAKSSAELLRGVVSATITIAENGKTRTVSKEEAVYMSLTAAAVKGDAKARGQLIALMEKLGIEQPETRAIDVVEYVIIPARKQPECETA